jgi:hypothetical protein
LIQDPLVLVSPPLSQTQVHHSIRFMVKGLTGRSFKSRSQPLSSSPLIQQYPFSRFTHSEIVDLFHSFKVQLGTNDAQRDTIIISFRNMLSDSFSTFMFEIIDPSRTNLFEMVTVVPMESESSQLLIQ